MSGNFSSSSIWKKINNYDDYYINEIGVVKSTKRKNPIFLSYGYSGDYLNVKLCKNGITKTFLVHRLVICSFKNKSININKEVNHIDGNKKNNHIGNLEFCSRSENQKHSFKIGLKSTRGEKHPRTNLSNEKAVLIRNEAINLKEKHGRNWGREELSNKHNVKPYIITNLLSGKSFKNVKQ